MNIINSIKYTSIAQVIVLFFGLFRSIILPKFMEIEEFGNMQVYLLYLGYIGIFMLGINDGINIRYSKLTKEEIKDRQFLGILYIYIVLLIIETVLGISLLFLCGLENTEILLYVIINIPIVGLQGAMIYYMQIKGEFKMYAIMTSIEKISSMVIIITCMYFIGITTKLVIYIDILVKAIVTGIIFKSSYKDFKVNNIKYKVAIKEIRHNIIVGSKFMLGIYISMLLFGIGRICIQNKMSLYTFSYYSLANSIVNMIIVFIGTMGVVIFQFLAKIDASLRGKYYHKIYKIFILCLPIIQFSYFIVYLIIILILPEYRESIKYLGLMYVLAIIQCEIQVINNTYYKILRQENLLIKQNLYSLIVMIALLWNVNITEWIILLQIAVLSYRCMKSKRKIEKILKINILKKSMVVMGINLMFLMVTRLEFNQSFIIYSVLLCIIFIKFRREYFRILKFIITKERIL